MLCFIQPDNETHCNNPKTNVPIKVTTQCLTRFYIIYLFFRNDKRNGLVTQDINTDHILASYIQYEQNPITNQNIEKMEYYTYITWLLAEGRGRHNTPGLSCHLGANILVCRPRSHVIYEY